MNFYNSIFLLTTFVDIKIKTAVETLFIVNSQ